jgi:hypothetical protein
MTTVKVQQDLANVIYTIARARGVTAHAIIEEAMLRAFGNELDAVRKLQKKQKPDQNNG